MRRAYTVEQESRMRKIFYKKSEVGDNIFIKSKTTKYQNIKLDNTINKTVFILTLLQSVIDYPALVFFYETSNKIDDKNIKKHCKGKAYVMLGMAIKQVSKMRENIHFDTNDVNTARKFWNNQIKKDGTFHFDTIGEIFGLGYGPKYCITKENNMSIGKFAEKKKLHQKMTILHKNSSKKKSTASLIFVSFRYFALTSYLLYHNPK